MSSQRSLSNIALVGFMGSGKSSIGRILADLLRYDFVDTDDLIVRREGRSISTIFEQSGEVAFRKLEHEVLRDVGQLSRTVISTGGGVVTNPDNVEQLKRHALIVCLWASAEKIFERVKSQSHRPLLNTADPLATIRELLAAREPFYRQADVLVNTDLRSPKEVAQQIVTQYRLALTAD